MGAKAVIRLLSATCQKATFRYVWLYLDGTICPQQNSLESMCGIRRLREYQLDLQERLENSRSWCLQICQMVQPILPYPRNLWPKSLLRAQYHHLPRLRRAPYPCYQNAVLQRWIAPRRLQLPAIDSSHLLRQSRVITYRRKISDGLSRRVPISGAQTGKSSSSVRRSDLNPAHLPSPYRISRDNPAQSASVGQCIRYTLSRIEGLAAWKSGRRLASQR